MKLYYFTLLGPVNKTLTSVKSVQRQCMLVSRACVAYVCAHIYFTIALFTVLIPVYIESANIWQNSIINSGKQGWIQDFSNVGSYV